MNESWCIVDSRKPDERVSVAGFFSRAGAERQIASWRERDKRGGRPDCHESMPYLIPKQVKEL